MMDRVLFFYFVLLLDGAFGAVVIVSVMKGDDVTLPLKTEEIKGASQLEWKLNDNFQVIVVLEEKIFEGRFKDRLSLNHDGSLKFNKIQTEDTGEYKLEIKSSGGSNYKTFSVTVSDKVESVSGMEGETVHLEIKRSPQVDDVIEWKFEGSLIFQGEGLRNPYPDNVFDDRFRGRLNLYAPGFLKITKLKTEDSGLYDVNIKSSNCLFHKRFTLTVTGSSPRSHQMKVGPGLSGVVIMLVMVLVY